jgi:hypothetical protein
MVTTQIDFMHVRSVSMIAGHIKWLARSLYWFGNVDKKMHRSGDEEKKAESKGNVTKVKKITLKEDELAMKEEKTLFEIIRYEMILLNELEKLEYKEEKSVSDMKPLMDRLSDKDKADFQQKIVTPFMNMKKHLLAASDQVRRVIGEMKADEAAFLAMQNMPSSAIRTTKGMDRDIAKKAKKEKKEVLVEQAAVAKMLSDLNLLGKYIAQKDKMISAEKLLKEIISQDEGIFKAMEEEIKNIADICIRAAIVYSRMFKFIQQNVLPTEKRLEETGFPPLILKLIREKDSELMKVIDDHKQELYKLVSYENYAQRAAA